MYPNLKHYDVTVTDSTGDISSLSTNCIVNFIYLNLSSENHFFSILGKR